MSTSGSTDFSANRNDIIEEAFSLLGIGAEGESLTSDMISRASRSLNMLVKDWSKDADLFLLTRGSLTAVVGQQSYTMGNGDFAERPLRIFDAEFRQNSNDIPMNRMSRQEYFELSVKTASGIPTNFYYDRQHTQGRLYLWPVLATGSTGTVEFTYARTIEDFDASTDDADFPQEWFLALSYNLAEILGDHYGGLTPHIQARAYSLKEDLKMWDEEDGSVYLQNDVVF